MTETQQPHLFTTSVSEHGLSGRNCCNKPPSHRFLPSPLENFHGLVSRFPYRGCSVQTSWTYLFALNLIELFRGRSHASYKDPHLALMNCTRAILSLDS